MSHVSRPRPHPKTVLVTGGTTRLGAAIAAHLRAQGWRVLTSSHRPDAGADIVADLSDPMGAARLYASALNLLGGNPPDALVNNAAVYDIGDAAARRVTAEAVRRETRDANGDARQETPRVSRLRSHAPDSPLRTLNFLSPQKLTILMAGRETGRGAVVNILDANLTDDATPYRAAKRELARETVRQAALFAETLRVNAVAPGSVLPPVGIRERALDAPLGRPTPDAVAAAVAFLLDAEFTTGVILPVDGGFSIARP